MTRRQQLIGQRIGLIALVGAVAIVFLSSSFIAGIVAVVTITAVLIDSIAFARLAHGEPLDSDSPPQTITVDLSRRS